MSLLERIDADAEGEEIEQGKRLIRVGDDRGLSLFERLNYRLHRLAWRTPLHKLRLRGACGSLRLRLTFLRGRQPAVPQKPKLWRWRVAQLENDVKRSSVAIRPFAPPKKPPRPPIRKSRDCKKISRTNGTHVSLPNAIR